LHFEFLQKIRKFAKFNIAYVIDMT